MVLDQVYIDVLRAAHLTCFAAGMGTALYHDFRTMRGINTPTTARDIDSIDRLHEWISLAFMGLWVTGVILIYVRTAFDLAAFSPKLWLKISLMVFMTVNARMISAYVVPMLKKNVGRALIDMPFRDLFISCQIAITSMFFWTSGMALGSSAYLKTAPWEVLTPLAVGWFVLCSGLGHFGVSVLRARAKAAADGRQQQLVFDYG